MKVWNSKYNINHDELKDKIYDLAKELDLMPHEIESELEELKFYHDDWDVDKLLSEIKRLFLYVYI